MNPQVASKIEDFFTKFKHKTYQKGEILIQPADDLGIFYLKLGRVKQYAVSRTGDELVVNIFKPIAFFPMSYAINNIPNIYYFEAAIDVEVWIAPKRETLDFIKSSPDVLYDLLSRVYIGVDGVLTRLTYLMSGNAYNRLISELVIHTKRFGVKDNLGKFKIHIRIKDLAIQTGISRETVSREIKILKDRGIVNFNRGILVIKNPDLLEKELM